MIESVFEDERLTLRPTTVTVDLQSLQHNVCAVKSLCGGAQIMGVVKANAYGRGLIRTARELLNFGAAQLGVAFLEEGIALRKAGIQAPILVLGGIIGEQIEHYLEYDLMLTASSAFKVRQIEAVAEKMKTRAKVHLKIDTGMERLGAHFYNADKLFEAAAQTKQCEISGVFSHLAKSQEPDGEFTNLQLQRFLQALEWFPNNGVPTPPRHLANSGAILQFPQTHFEIVRPGIMLYGLYPGKATRRSVELKPVLSLTTKVVYFKVVKKGASVGYDGIWTAPCDTRVVTLPAGYGDGYRRALSNKAEVLIGGHRYPVVGTISMDQMMVNIGADSAFNGDEVVLIGSQGDGRISCEELAELSGTIAYEVLTGLSSRVPRVYV